MEKQRLHYYEQLAELYPTIGKASTEIINLQSILYLPKGTEHFLSDIHGEFKAFSHVLRNGSGAVRKKIDDVFGHTLSTADKMSLATLIYYPQKKIELVRQTEDDIENWYKITLYRLIEVCKTVSSKYTRSKVRKALPEDYAYVIEELITEKQEVLNKEAYYEAIINTILELGQADNFIVALAELVQRLEQELQQEQRQFLRINKMGKLIGKRLAFVLVLVLLLVLYHHTLLIRLHLQLNLCFQKQTQVVM